MNLNQLKKNQLLWMINNRCQHDVPFIQHPNCYRKQYGTTMPGDVPEKIGFLDIEATNLKADFGYCFSYAIKELNGKILGRVLESKEIRSYTFDRKLMAELCRDMKKFDRLVVHYGLDRRYDIPFLRTRCIYYGLDFPEHKSIYGDDTFSMARNKLQMSRNRLENLCGFFNIPAKGHKMEPSMWQKALAGHPESLKYIWTHNVEDVNSLESLWKKLNPYVNKTKSSI